MCFDMSAAPGAARQQKPVLSVSQRTMTMQDVLAEREPIARMRALSAFLAQESSRPAVPPTPAPGATLAQRQGLPKIGAANLVLPTIPQR